MFEPITYCGKCYACRCGHHNVCRELKVLGCIVDGIFQEYVVMPRSQVYEYDASKMTYQQAALCEPFTIGLQANWRGDVRPGDVVLVHGGGPIGLIVANIAKSAARQPEMFSKLQTLMFLGIAFIEGTFFVLLACTFFVG